MKEVFLLVSDNGAGLFLQDKIEDGMYVPLDGGDCAADAAELIKDQLEFNFKGKKLVLVANYKKTLIRVADKHEFSHKSGFFRKKITNSDAWEVIKSVFPIGPSINEDTHLFDISLFGNRKFVCFGIPVDLCEKLAQIGEELTGSIHRVSRLESIENLMFMKHNSESKIVVFPQDDGFRVLTVQDGLPENAFYISNHPDRRMAEFERILTSLGKRKKICALSFITNEANDDLEWISKYK